VSNKRGLAVVFGCVISALVAYAALYPRFHPRPPEPAATPGGAAARATASTPVVTTGATVSDIAANAVNPLSWSRLTPAQREALAPLAREWDRFSDERKRKWIKIAARYPKLRKEEQKRLHGRMAEWVRMTPEQRRVARENYQLSQALSAEARENAWEAYQQLPDELKKKLAAAEKSRRPTVVSAPPSGRTEIKDINRLIRAREHAQKRGAPVPEAAFAASEVAPAVSAASAPTPAVPAASTANAAGAAVPKTEAVKPAQSVPWYFNDHAQ
jgi:Protein of unknown function (DUF3106)